MKKQLILTTILDVLGIEKENKFYSRGSTVTRQGLREILYKLNPSSPKTLLKQEVIKRILLTLNVKPQSDHFSTGSTVTHKALFDIYSNLSTTQS